jgi:surfeit locus 1 family protein
VIDDLLKNETFLKYLPIAAGLVLIGAFISLGRWQLDRAAEKTALLELFASGGGYVEPPNFSSLEEFDRIEVPGRYRPDRQVLVDNIPKDGRLGYYVVTPFEPSTNDPLLLVNRGWVPKGRGVQDLPDIDVGTEFTSVRGLVGHLPRVAVRPGEAFAEHGEWPRVALYPTPDEVAAELDETVLPVVLLLAPEATDGFVRDWQPNVSGPMTHYSYAFQWFAMAAAVVGLLGWHLRKRARS